MAGPLIRLGRYRSSGAGSGPDFAVAHSNGQIATFTNPGNPGDQQLIPYSMGGWFGVNSGNPTARAGIMYHTSGTPGPDGRRPGGVTARTIEFSPTAGYDGSNEGQFIDDIRIENPYVMQTNHDHVVVLGSRNGDTATSMAVAGDISEPNEYLYRKNITGTNLQDGDGSSGTNEGQLNIWINTEENVAPGKPTNLSPAGNVSTRTPQFGADFNDVNKVLNNGIQWDHVTKTQVRVRRDSDDHIMWDHQYNSTAWERQHHRTISPVYSGQPLLYYVTYTVEIRHWDRGNREGAWSDPQYFMVLHNNSRPNVPSNPSGFGTRNGNLTVTVGHDFTDPDLPLLPDGQAWERFEAKRVVVRRQSDGVLHSDVTVATTTTERANRRSSTTITLTEWNTWFTVAEYHQDRYGAWSLDATRTVRAVSGGSVDTPTSPSGRKTTPANPGSITAIYRNTVAVNATKMRARMVDEHGNATNTSGWKTINVGRNNPVTMTWVESGFGTVPNGVTRGVQVQVTDASGLTTGWSEPVWFTTNAAPTIATITAPQVTAYSAMPEMWVTVSDPDIPHPNDLIVYIEILDTANGNTVLSTKQAGWYGGNQYMIYGSAYAGDIPGHMALGAVAFAHDGNLYSGGASTYAQATRSAIRHFAYAAVPSVTITSPPGPAVGTMQPTLSWTSTNQLSWRVQGRTVGGTLVFDTGERDGSAQSYLIAGAQFWLNGERWNKDETFVWSVGVRDGSGLWGWSSGKSLTLESTPPDPILVESVAAMALPGCTGTHYIQTQIQQSSSGTFLRYEADRMEIDGPEGNVIDGSLLQNYFVNSASAATLFTDFDVTSNQWYRYAFRQLIQSGNDIIPSEPVYAESMVSFRGTMLHMPFDPLGTFLWLPYGTERYEPEAEWFQGGSELMSVGAMAPTFYSDGTDYVHWRLESTLVPRDGMSTEQQLAAFRRMWNYQNHRKAPNGRPNSVTLREGRGGGDSRVTGRITLPRHRHSYSRMYTVEFEFRELQEDES